MKLRHSERQSNTASYPEIDALCFKCDSLSTVQCTFVRTLYMHVHVHCTMYMYSIHCVYVYVLTVVHCVTTRSCVVSVTPESMEYWSTRYLITSRSRPPRPPGQPL